MKVFHWTSHPGIEGTAIIKKVIKSLQRKGYLIELTFLKNISYDRVKRELAKADLTIGKMKMGYYANSQIEAMAAGVPTITWVRPEFMTHELANSGFILSHINDLEKTLEYYLQNPKMLALKKGKARSSIKMLHNNEDIVKKYKQIYCA